HRIRTRQACFMSFASFLFANDMLRNRAGRLQLVLVMIPRYLGQVADCDQGYDHKCRSDRTAVEAALLARIKEWSEQQRAEGDARDADRAEHDILFGYVRVFQE